MAESGADNITKRERQKRRREERLARERTAAKRAQRNRILAFVALGVLVAGGIGALVAREIGKRNAAAALEEEVAARLTELGCTPTDQIERPDLGAGHLSPTPEELAAAPPDVIYTDRPTWGGQHAPQVVAGGVYDTLIDERLLVHNLEHGYVNVYWDQDAPAEQVDALKEWARAEIDGEHPKMVVAPWTGEPFADGSNFAFVGWNARQMCGQFDPDVGQVFTTNYYGNDGLAPQQERNIAAHQPDGQGVYDPTEANVLLPPLDTELGGDAPNEADVTATETPAGADPTEGVTQPAATAPDEPTAEPEPASS